MASDFGEQTWKDSTTFRICSMAVARVVFSCTISCFIDSSSVAYAFWVIVVVVELVVEELVLEIDWIGTCVGFCDSVDQSES